MIRRQKHECEIVSKMKLKVHIKNGLWKLESLKDVDKISMFEPEIIVECPHRCVLNLTQFDPDRPLNRGIGESEIKRNMQPIEIEAVQFVDSLRYNCEGKIEKYQRLQFQGDMKTSLDETTVLMVVNDVRKETQNDRSCLELYCRNRMACKFKGTVKLLKKKVTDLFTFENRMENIDDISIYEPTITVETPHTCLHDQIEPYPCDEFEPIPQNHPIRSGSRSTEPLTKNQPSCSNLDSGRCSAPKSASLEGEIPFGSENEEGFLMFSQKF